jgi:hypothetical protein
MTEPLSATIDPVHKADAEALLGMARAFHIEDGHPLSAAGEAAVRQIADGGPFAETGRRLKRCRLISTGEIHDICRRHEPLTPALSRKGRGRSGILLPLPLRERAGVRGGQRDE